MPDTPIKKGPSFMEKGDEYPPAFKWPWLGGTTAQVLEKAGYRKKAGA